MHVIHGHCAASILPCWVSTYGNGVINVIHGTHNLNTKTALRGSYQKNMRHLFYFSDNSQLEQSWCWSTFFYSHCECNIPPYDYWPPSDHLFLLRLASCVLCIGIVFISEALLKQFKFSELILYRLRIWQYASINRSNLLFINGFDMQISIVFLSFKYTQVFKTLTSWLFGQMMYL